MKKLYTLLTAVILTASVFAQAPEEMSYQAVVRDAGNALVTSQAVGMQISILQGSISGTAVYVETQTPTTNINGLVSIEIGSGTVVSGTFNTIDWSAGSYFIKTETDPTGGNTYSITGTSQLLSVPYALHAKTAESVTGAVNYTETDPTFTAWDKSTGISITESQISDLTHTVDNNTQLDETAVDNFVANNGYLTSEVDGSTTNEIQNLTQVLSTGNDANNQSIVNVDKMAIGTASITASTALEVNSTTGAMLLPRMTITQRDALTPALGMVIYNSSNNIFQGYALSNCNDTILHNNNADINSSSSVGTDGSGTPNYVGQSFTPTSCSGILGSVNVKVNRASSDMVTCSVYTGEGYGGSLLGDVNITLNSVGSMSIDLSSLNINLQAGSTYSFRLYSAANFTTCPTVSTMAGTGSYSNGNLLNYQGNPSASFDMWFEMYLLPINEWVDLH